MPARASSATSKTEASASDQEQTTGAPRWVKVFGIIGVLVLLLLFAVEHLVFERLPGGGMRHQGTHAAPTKPDPEHTTPGRIVQ